MSVFTPEMVAAGAAALEEYAGGSYTQWRKVVVRVWQEMHRAQAGEVHGGGETFALALERNLAAQKELATAEGTARWKRDARVAAAKEHGLAVPDDEPDPGELAEREWQEWFAANGG